MRSAWILAAVLVAAGCGAPTGTLTGKVTYDGKPVAGGAVSFCPVKDGRPYHGPIDKDGNYTVTGVPLGEALVCLSPSPDFSPAVAMEKSGKRTEADGSASGVPQRPFPAKYEDPRTSGFKVTVKAGDNPFDIPMPK